MGVKLGLISDVHANAVALRAVLSELKARGIERILCAGDIVGYYPYPNETVALLRENRSVCVLGNHDRSVLKVDTSGMNPHAHHAVLWTARHLEADTRRYLENLPVSTTVRSDRLAVTIYHGSPRDMVDYVYEDDADESLLSMARSPVLILGHTHIPFVRRFAQGMIVNPGSVGQPRDGDPRAAYAILDTSVGLVDFYRVSYDIEAVASRTREEGLPRMLSDRLFYGR